ncbi:MAG TPA: YidB family protein [Trebonia sp.]|nr:YidB family protein [Trebonia sp.]
MALNDILGKLGGQNGQQGGLAAISKLFDGDGMQGILTKLQASGLDKQVMSWIGHGKNDPVTGDDIKNAVDPQKLSQVAQQTGMSQDEVADNVAQALPEAVDKATPGGAVPQQGFNMDTLTGMFKK